MCETCKKRKHVFTHTETNEKFCLVCGVKMQYKLNRLKGVYKALKLYFKSRRMPMWETKKEKSFLLTFFLIALSLLIVYSVGYILFTKQHILLPVTIISAIRVAGFWKDELIK